VDAETYREMRAKLVEEITLTEMELRDTAVDELEIMDALDFAESVLLNASNLWNGASFEVKQRLQQVLFPKGVV
jgi:hypothetical protein